MSFQFDGCRWTLSGLDAPTIQLASISEVTQEVDRTHLMCAICWLTEEQPGVNGKIAEEVENRPDMLKLLAKYEEVFWVLNQLPPTKEIDYHINLKDGTKPINVRPYRYAHF